MSSDRVAATDAEARRGKRLEVLCAEYSRVQTELELRARTSGDRLQYLTVIFAAGVVAATYVPVAFLAVPVFWSLWLLQVAMLDQDSLKLQALARWIEDETTAVLGAPGLQMERLGARTGPRHLTHFIFYVFAGLAYAGAWSIGVWAATVQFDGAGQAVTVASAVVLAVVAASIALRAISERDRLYDQYLSVLAQSEPPPAGTPLAPRKLRTSELQQPQRTQRHSLAYGLTVGCVAVAAPLIATLFGFGFWMMFNGGLNGSAAEQSLFGTGLALVGIGFSVLFRAFDWIRELRSERPTKRRPSK